MLVREMAVQIRCFTHSYLSTSSQLTDRLKCLCQDSGKPDLFQEFSGLSVKQVVVSQNHIALLLGDGHVYRIQYSLSSGDTNTKDKSDDDGASTSSILSGSRGASPRRDQEAPGFSSFAQRFSGLVARRGRPFGRRLVVERQRDRLSRALLSRVPAIPASDVPEELVEEAMAVLQGKSREVVIRELQRTNLDVNTAVNNLLSRDDDEVQNVPTHDQEEGSLFPSGDELLTLLGTGTLGEDELEELLSITGRNREEMTHRLNREGRPSAIYNDPLVAQEIRSWVTMADRAATGNTASSSSSAPVTGGSKIKGGNTRKDSGTSMYFSSKACWRFGDEDKRFTQIASLKSNLLAVDDQGVLYHWPWNLPIPPFSPHPRIVELGLEGERVKFLSAKLLRASLVTDSGKIVTWLDPTVAKVGHVLEQEATLFQELSGETVVYLTTSELFSVVYTDSGKLLWWGVLPFTERKLLITQFQDKNRSFNTSSGNSLFGRGNQIQEGSQVCLRSRPIYSSGCQAFYIKGPVVKCGELQESVFSLSEKCRFKILPESNGEVVEPMEVHSEVITIDDNPSVGTKRRHPEDEDDDLEQYKEELWALRDVVFLSPPLSSAPLGRVVKLDGLYAAVLFPTLSTKDEEESKDQMTENGEKSLLSRCRLLRRDDLVVIPGDSSHPDPVCIQNSPKKMKLSADSVVLALTADIRGLHVILANHGTLTCSSFNFETGKNSLSSTFPDPSAHFLLQQLPPRPLLRSPPMQLISLGLSLWLLVDTLGGLYPLARDCVGGMKHLPLLNLPPVQAIIHTPCSSKQFLVAMAVQSQKLIPLIRNGTLSSLKIFLDALSTTEIESCLKEQTHGGCNILHLLAALSAPSPPVPQTTTSSSGSARSRTGHPGLREMMHQALNLPTSSLSESRLWSVGMTEGEDESEETEKNDKTTQNLLLLRHLCSLSSKHREIFVGLMTEVNLKGYTPFMTAVSCKAYSSACELLELAYLLSEDLEEEEEAEELMVAMLFPGTSHCDDNPLFVLCRNDPCSFTWTGEEHIHQDIFECRTCGLVGSLCCCTECAYTCHRGHDCSFKRASPNAYCDCWEKCSCQALAQGDEHTRAVLLQRLLAMPFLSTRTNSRGEHLLGMLASLVARQTKEQNQWMGKKSGNSLRSRSSRYDTSFTSDAPVHSFNPPKFAGKALSTVLEDWPSVKSALACDKSESEGGGGGEWPFCLSLTEQQKILEAQSSTKHLDALTFTLLAKTPHNCVETLVTTLVRMIGPQRDNLEAVIRCQQFLRSVIRIFVVCGLEKVAGPEVTTSLNRRKNTDGEHSPVTKEAIFVLSSLAPLSLTELINSSRGIILPVCLGVARPFLPNIMVDKHKVCEELFSLPPADLYRQVKNPPVSGPNMGTISESAWTSGGVPTGGGGGGGGGGNVGGGDGMSDSDSEGEDTHIHGDASSTATIGSGPIPFFSDQESSDGEDIESGVDEASIDGGEMDEENYNFAITENLVSRIQGSTHWALPETTGTTRKYSRSSARDTLSYSTSVSLLSQAFSMIVRLISELMDVLVLDGPHPPFVLHPLTADREEIQFTLWEGFEGVWQWLSTVMDATESQLRLGCALNVTWTTELTEHSRTSTTTPAANKSTESPSLDNRRGFLNYMLSLMRAESSEHGAILPGLDIARLEHVAWVLDSLIYLLTHINPPPTHSPIRGLETSGQSTLSEERRRFFRRSQSTICLSYPPPSPFSPLIDALPLAEKPQLLHPRQTKETLFGYGQQDTLEVWPDTPLSPPPILPLINHPIPWKIGLNFATDKRKTEQQSAPVVLSSEQVLCETSHSLTASVLMGRWCMTVELMGRVFVDTLGRQQNSIFSQLQSFDATEREIRREMDALRSSVHRDLQLDVERGRESLLLALFRQLNNQCEYRRMSSGQQPLCVHRLRVTFKNEPGEGSGVVRSFFTAVAEAVISEETLPELDYTLTSTRALSLAEVIDEYTGKGTDAVSSSVGELCPLFFQPGKTGFYSIRVGSHTPARINAYRNIGRVIGLALLHSEMMPLPLCRHIYKYLLNRKISWHDMAFFDPQLYEGLRKLIISAHQEPEGIRNMDLSWQVTLGEYEGGETLPLLSTLSNKPVTTSDVYDYVQHYAELRMIRIIEEPLMAMRSGIYDVLPTNSLESLTAEDMRLLLCGCQQVDTDTLKKITIFSDESRKGSDQIVRFKSWFWSIVERMSNRERQDLLYFWTSSPSMPANPESYQPAPSVTIRPADDQHLPTSNTCISRLYIPMYSNKALLRSKLMASIKIKAFGFI